MVGEVSNGFGRQGERRLDLVRIVPRTEFGEPGVAQRCQGKASHGLDDPVELEGFQGAVIHELDVGSRSPARIRLAGPSG